MNKQAQVSHQVSSRTGLIVPADQYFSPNQDDRPQDVEPDLIVVHSISLPPGIFGGDAIARFFRNALMPDEHPYFAEIANLRVSAHLLIRRSGQLLQFVPFHRRAWHAGESVYAGRTACNDFSVGIEVEGEDDTPYTVPQYQSLASVIGALLAAYPGLSSRKIVGHSDIAPGRKTDPGPAFEWPHLYDALRALGLNDH